MNESTNSSKTNLIKTKTKTTEVIQDDGAAASGSDKILQKAEDSSTKNKNKNENLDNIEDILLETPRITRSRNGSTASSISNTSRNSLKRPRRDSDEAVPENDMELSSLVQFGLLHREMIELIEKQRNKSSKLTKEMQEVFVKELEKMRTIVTKLALENASLRGKLIERSRSNPIASFSDIVRRQTSDRNKIPPVTGATKKPVERRHTLIIKHEKRDQSKPLEKKTIIALLNPVKEKLKLKTCRNTRSGDIVLEAATAKDLQRITENQSLITGGYKMERPNKRLPKIIIFDIPSEYTEEEVKEAIILQNEEKITEEDKERIMNNLHFKFKNGKKEQETSNRVYEVTPELRNVLRRLNNVYIDTRRCKISDFLTATRCFKCHGLGHTTKYCPAQKDICGHCAEEGHDYKSCPNKARPRICVTCKRAGKPHQHAMDKNCPEFKAALEQIRLKTDYG